MHVILIGLAALITPVHRLPSTVYQSPLPATSHQPPATYRAHFLRAAPGHLMELIELYQDRIEFLEAAGEAPPVFMRHSQGDQWDLMVLSPIGSLEEYFSEARAERLDRAGFEARLRDITAWQEELFVAGPPADTLAARNAGAGFYHVEVFRALPGKYHELVRQREMENSYYHATERDGNLIFTRLAGSAWDCFTIGFYRDIAHFVEMPDLPPETFEQAAVDAGFESRGTIGTYLRTLIDEHHDTLATRVEPEEG